MIRKILFSLFLFSILCRAFAQSAADKTYPVIGQLVPDFEITEVYHSTYKSLSPEILRGRNVVLIFWARGCLGCVRDLPKESALQKKLGDSVMFVMVAPNSQPNKDLFELSRKTNNLELTAAYSDELFTNWKISALAQYVFIDKQGKVAAVCGGGLTEDNLRRFSRGEDVPEFNFKRTDIDFVEQRAKLIDPNKPLMFENNGHIPDSSIKFWSFFAKWEFGMPVSFDYHISARKPRNFIKMLGVRPIALYKMAYLGTTLNIRKDDMEMGFYPGIFDLYPKPIIETKDSLLIKNERYVYSLVVPREKANQAFMMKWMQDDLKRYFGYNVRIEQRLLPCFFLERTSDKAFDLYTKNPKAKEVHLVDRDRTEIVNYSLDVAIQQIADGMMKNLRVYNKSGINGKIDLSYKALCLDFNSVNAELKKQGLQLVLGTSMQSALVISDSNNSND